MLLYIHVPFCRQKCAYCAFYSIPLAKEPPLTAMPVANRHALPSGLSFTRPRNNVQLDDSDLLDAYCQTLIREITLRSQATTAPVNSIFFGGGTPSLLSGRHLESIFNTIQRHYSLDSDVEITMEANPESAIRPHWLHEARQAGVNRLSLGVQSFADSDLNLLGRSHTAGQAREALRLAHKARFLSISLDLMWALPWVTSAPRPVSPVAHWLATLEAALEGSPHHISAYGLILEDGTPLAKWAEQTEWAAPAGLDGTPEWTARTGPKRQAELAWRDGQTEATGLAKAAALAEHTNTKEANTKHNKANPFGQTTPKDSRATPLLPEGETLHGDPQEQAQTGRPRHELTRQEIARQEQRGQKEYWAHQREQWDTTTKGSARGQRLAFPSEEEEKAMYLQGIELLAQHGFEHYEISNFALAGHRCRHNLGYWLGSDYLGFGPAAVSTLGATRLSNVANVKDWTRGIESGHPRCEAETLSAHALREEKIMLSLRMTQGLALADWDRISPHPLPAMPFARQLVQEGLATFYHDQDGGRFALTPSGMLVSNAIISRLFEGMAE